MYKEELISIIKWLSVGSNKIYMDFYIGEIPLFNIIEIDLENNLTLHTICEDSNVETDWEDLPTFLQKEIYYLFLRDYFY